MEIRIERSTSLDTLDLSTFDSSFDVSVAVAKPFEQSLASTQIVTRSVARRTKTYPEDMPTEDEDEDGIHVVLVALSPKGQLCGYIKASKAWNVLVSLDDIAVDRPYRRHGVARKLMEQLQSWTREMGLPAIRAETQDINVTACAFYRSNGFKFGGYDEYLYHGLETKEETALYWYWFA